MTSRQIKAAQLRRRMAIQAMTPHRLPEAAERSRTTHGRHGSRYARIDPNATLYHGRSPRSPGSVRSVSPRDQAPPSAGRGNYFYRGRTGLPDICQVQSRNGRGFLDRVDDLYFRIKSGYGLHGVEGAVSLLDAACRLIERYNHQLERTYYFEHAEPIYKIPSLLDCIPCKRRDITAQIAKALQPTSNPQAKRTAQ